jgi:hypothetical protein
MISWQASIAALVGIVVVFRGYRTRTLTLDLSAQEIDAVPAHRASAVGRGSRTGRHPSRQHRGCIPGRNAAPMPTALVLRDE